MIKKRGKHLKVRQTFPKSKLIWFLLNRSVEFYSRMAKMCCTGHTLMTVLSSDPLPGAAESCSTKKQDLLSTTRLKSVV